MESSTSISSFRQAFLANLQDSKSETTVSDRSQLSDSIEGRIAIVHEWLSTNAGSEKVTESLINLFQDVKVYSTVDFLSNKDREQIMGGRKPKTTFIQHLPFARRHFRYYLPIFPFAVRRHNLTAYPLIVSSSHAFAHGVKSHKNQIHVSYCHTPMRYIWDMQELYLESNNLQKGPLAFASRLLTSLFRKWDAKVSKNVDYYISNSNFTAQRIKNYYGRTAKVIYPPVEIDRFSVASQKEDFYVTASRLVCYKKVEMVVEAFNKMPDKKLVVIGDGKRKDLITALAGPNITILSHLAFDDFHRYMRKAKAFVFGGKEDFGITLVEAQACGTPVIAFGEGGAKEIVVDQETGLLFKEQTSNSMIQAIHKFEREYETAFCPQIIRKNSERFSLDKFNSEVLAFINSCMNEEHAR